MARTHPKVRYSPKGKEALTPTSAAQGVESALKILEGRWKLVILFHLFGGKVMRFSDLERAIPAISQKMLIQQLRQMENDGVVQRTIHHQVPPKVEYCLTDWGQALCPALDAMLKWAALREALSEPAAPSRGEARSHPATASAVRRTRNRTRDRSASRTEGRIPSRSRSG
jgi:DNA-binding HxlR family transcriptional regulator